MGLLGVPGIFQRLINHYLRKFQGDLVLCYLDDILICSKEHLESICVVLQVLLEKKLYAQGSKLGNMEKESSKVKEVRNWPSQRLYKMYKLSWGLQVFQKFVHKFAEKTPQKTF